MPLLTRQTVNPTGSCRGSERPIKKRRLFFWGHGEREQLVPGSGLFVGPEGREGNHHFLPAEDPDSAVIFNWDSGEKNTDPRWTAALLKKVKAGDLSMKSVNNILAVLSKALRYAEEARIIDRAPRVKLFKLERPEKEWWEFAQYARVLAAAGEEGPEWYAAVCLAGEAGLRIGEVRALRWERDIDLVAGTITVNEQTRKGVTGSPKGITRRKVPMTETLLDAVKAQSVVRRGYVVRNADGSPRPGARPTRTTGSCGCSALADTSAAQ